MNIYISGLSYGTNDADLTNLFAEFGEVSSAKVIFDRESGRSRGFAFVEYRLLPFHDSTEEFLLYGENEKSFYI